jgi:hypothetical protein
VFTKTGVISPVHAKNWFNDKGWYVAKTPSGDLCPDHYHHDGRPKKEDRVTTPPPPSIPTENVIATAIMSEPVEAFAPPVPMQDYIPKTDKRLIIAKLEEVYEDETRGYRKGWSDLRVAGDLGVDQEWVELIRASIFGPAFSEADAEERLLKQGIEDHYSRIVNLANEIATANRLFAEMMAELEALIAKHRKLTDG